MPTVYATRALASVLCELAADADPDSVSVPLAATPANELEPVSGALTAVDNKTDVLSDFYFPDAADAITSVFGMDLATPAGQTAGRFVSHPKGEYEVSLADDLHVRLLVAVPPWNPDHLRAYDRNGTRQSLVLVDATTPSEDAPNF
ncbi:hypothetical protein [Halobacterium zhouii]|uniref:hypothetical protein n=1 Tax=Halobacterium zhouii TaxID=2902624 RepID=UPI001E469524|nr:hypothetical protein [Halobacterium zhouii]